MKKWLKAASVFAVLLALLLVIESVALGEQEGSAGSALTMNGVITVPNDTEFDIQRNSSIAVGATSQMTGRFATGFFGNGASDLDVNRLLQGYSTVEWVRDVGLVVDGTVVSAISVADTDAGRRYTFTIRDGLEYNDGTPIGARDYVFSLLMSASPALREIGGSARGAELFAGYEAYASGEESVLTGVRLLSENRFSVTIDRANLPYFYGLAVVSATPYPISVIAPDCEVMDDGDGAYIDGDFSAELLNRTLLDPQTGYVFNPRVTSGPYQFEGFDAAAQVVRLSVNERYRGNFEGAKPSIERITFRQVDNKDIPAQLEAGELDIVNKLTELGASNAVGQLADELNLQTASYERSGLAFLAFACDNLPTDSVAVRNAIARAIDQDKLILDALGIGRGVPVHGYYGAGQWMLREAIDAEEDDAINGYLATQSLAVAKDLGVARTLLEHDGWTLNADGHPYAGEGTRYKDIGGALAKLEIRWAKTLSNPIADALEAQLTESFDALGIGLSVTEVPFDRVLSMYNRVEDSDFNMYFMATNFATLFDPYYDFGGADERFNNTRIHDEQLVTLALDMRETSPSDTQSYVMKWLEFQRRFSEVMPMVPLYSNAYLDAYASRLTGYNIAQHISWADAIVYTRVQS